MHFLKDDEELLMPSPYYVNYVNYAEFAGAKPVCSPMKVVVDEQGNRTWQYDWENFESLITDKTKVVFLTNPHNPTGKMFTMEDIEILTNILDKRPDILVVADDVYFHLPFHGEKLPYYSFASYKNNWERTVSVFSVGKLFSCTGWKTGWVVGPADLIKHISYVHESSCFVINVPSQVAVASALDDMHKPYQGHSNYIEYV